MKTRFIISFFVLLLSASPAYAYCARPTAPHKPPRPVAPEPPDCLKEFSGSEEYCEERELDDYRRDVQDYERRFDAYAREIENFAREAREFAEDAKRYKDCVQQGLP